MTIDELEKSIDQLEKAEVLDGFSGEFITSDTRHLNWLYEVAKQNNIRVICWPKMILIPETHYLQQNEGVFRTESLGTYERLYRNGIVSINGRYTERKIQTLFRKFRTYMIDKTHRDMSWEENLRKIEYKYGLKNLNTDVVINYGDKGEKQNDNGQTIRCK